MEKLKGRNTERMWINDCIEPLYYEDEDITEEKENKEPTDTTQKEKTEDGR